MKIAFQRLAVVTPLHPYYSEGCRDLEFIPTSATADLLRAGRTIARMRNGALHLLYETDAPDTPVSSLAGTTLYFGLRVSNPYFSNFTVPVIGNTVLTPLYENAALPSALDAPVGVRLAAGMAGHAPTSTDRPLKVTLRTAGAQALAEQVLQSGEASASFDLRFLSTGRYLLDEEHAGALQHRHHLLIDTDLRDYGVWGVLALKIAPSFYASAAELAINLAARKDTLRYYVVASNFPQAEFDQLNVSDGDNAIVFDKIVPGPPSDQFPANQGYLDKNLLAPDSETRIAVFQSQTEVERREHDAKKLKLSRNSTVLIERLPLPGPEKVRADLIVQLSKP